MTDLLLSILIIIALFPLIGLLVKTVRKYPHLLLPICVTMGLLFTLITLFLLNRPAFILPQQSEAIQSLAILKKKGTQEKQYKVIRDNFVYVDNSFSLQLIPQQGGNQLSHPVTSITNRKELIRLFRLLKKEDNLTDAIVCDVYFDQPSPDDSELRAVLTEPEIASKLLLAHNFLHPNLPVFATLPDSCYGNVVEEGTGDFFSTFHPIYQGKPSLAFLLYKRFTGLVHESPVQGAFALSSYIPEISVTDEKRLYPSLSDTNQPGESTDSTGYPYFQLGDIISDSTGDDFPGYLAERKENKQRNIILIGTFKDKDADMHQTFAGKLHGMTILLNLFLSLQKGQHEIGTGLIGYVWLCFSLVFTVLFCKSLHLFPFRPARDKTPAAHQPARTSLRRAFWKFIQQNGKAILKLVFIEELQLWLVLLLTISTAVLFDRIINGFALLLLFTIIHKLLVYYDSDYE